MFFSDIGLSFSFFFCFHVCFSVWFCSQGDGDLIEWAWACSFLCNSFWKRLIESLIVGQNYPRSHLVLDIFLENFKSLFQYLWSVYSHSLFLPCLVLKGCTSLSICAFLLDCPFYLHIILCSSLLWYLEFHMSVFLMKPALITLLWSKHKCKMREYKPGKVSAPHTEECTLIWLRNFFFFFSFQFYCNIIDL